MMQQLKAYLEGLNDRERQLVYGAAIVIVVFVCYQFIWAPFASGLDNLQKKVDQQQRDAAWMNNNLAELQELNRHAVRAEAAGQSIYAMVESSVANKFGGAIQVRQEGQKGVRVVISNAPFDEIMTWLDGLQNQQIVIKEMNAEALDSVGYVKCTLLLEG